MGALAIEKGDVNPKQLAIIGALLLTLGGVLYFQLVVKHRRGAPESVPAAESVESLAALTQRISAPAAPAEAAGAGVAAPGPVDLETLDAATLVLPGGRLSAGARPTVAFDPFRPSEEVLLAFRARDPRFALPDEAAGEEAAAPLLAYEPPPDPAPPLRATVVDGAIRLAILGDRIMAPGESIAGYELTEVTPEGVVLRKEGAETALSLEEK